MLTFVRVFSLFLALWLPVQSSVASVVHDYALQHLQSDADDHYHVDHAPVDQDFGPAAHDGGDGSAGDFAHAYCHLALSPALVSFIAHIPAGGMHCLHPAREASFSAPPPDEFVRPPLARG